MGIERQEQLGRQHGSDGEIESTTKVRGESMSEFYMGERRKGERARERGQVSWRKEKRADIKGIRGGQVFALSTTRTNAYGLVTDISLHR